MMKKMKELKNAERQVVMWQIESVRNIYNKDTSDDAKLHIIENAISLVDKNKTCLGKFKNMSSLEKNRIALNMLQSLK